MKNLIGIALVSTILFACNQQTKPTNELATNAALTNALSDAKHETELLKLNYELELLKAQQQNGTPRTIVVTKTAKPILNRPDAYVAHANLPKEAPQTDDRSTQRIDDEWKAPEAEKKDEPVVAAKEEGPAEIPATPEKAPAEVEKKSGMSSAAKGAIIGAGVGAATGAVVSKNHRVKGAIVGAVAGAGVGTVAGVVVDKKKEKASSTPYFATNGFLK